MCCFLRFVTCRPAGGLGAPIGSPHASFMGLSEAIFQNWLHLRTCGGAHFLGWFVEGGSPGACLLQGKVGPRAGSGRSRAPRAGPACTPSLGPPGCRAVTLSLLSFLSWHLQQTLPPVFGKMLPRLHSVLLSVPPAAWIKMAWGSREKEETESQVWYRTLKFGSQPSCCVADEW